MIVAHILNVIVSLASLVLDGFNGSCVVEIEKKVESFGWITAAKSIA